MQRIREYCGPLVLPILLAVVPTLYLYGNNAEKLKLLNLFRMLVSNLLLAIVIYLVFMAFYRFQPMKAANATFVFLIFFNVYGLGYRYLIQLDVIRVKHYTLLPLMLTLAIYSILFINKVKNSASTDIWKHLVLVVGVLVLLNLSKIIPAEIEKAQSYIANAPQSHPEELLPADQPPDIYYIILDEFAGFQAMREYWNYEEVDNFVDYLKARDFFVAEASHGSSQDTLREIATRLNYQEYPPEKVRLRIFFNDIYNNKVMQYLKTRGYTTVVYDETNMSYPSFKGVEADHLYEYESPSIPNTAKRKYGFYLDEFGELIIDNTMLYAFSHNYRRNDPKVGLHSSMISFTAGHVASTEVPSPKFVYVHLMLPHVPFIFNQDGSIKDSDQSTNWNHYLDNYIYAIRVAEIMIDNILRNADLNNPPIIILQSDHGARNLLPKRRGSIVLPNYPEEFKTLILYALSIPGYDYSTLPQDINPINTFPIVFNYLFEAQIPLMK
jgi:hypothetical protein